MKCKKLVILIAILALFSCEKNHNTLTKEMKFNIILYTDITSVPPIIYGEGIITKDTPKAFQSVIDKAIYFGLISKDRTRLYFDPSSLPTVVLNSDGGDLLASLKLGKMIRKEGLKTALASISIPAEYVFDEDEFHKPIGQNAFKVSVGHCESACAYSYFGGSSRSLKLDSKSAPIGMLGVHQFYGGFALNKNEAFTTLDYEEINKKYKTETEKSQYYTALIISYLSDMGIDTKLLAEASSTQEIYYVDANYLVELSGVTIDIDVGSGVLSNLVFEFERDFDKNWDLKSGVIFASAACYQRSSNPSENIIRFWAELDPEIVFGIKNNNELNYLRNKSAENYNGFVIQFGDRSIVAPNNSLKIKLETSKHYDPVEIYDPQVAQYNDRVKKNGQRNIVALDYTATVAQWKEIVDNASDNKFSIELQGQLANSLPIKPNFSVTLSPYWKLGIRDILSRQRFCYSEELDDF